ncbi:hypothetical protein BHE74_00018817 [Ensete ventricosum]|nr:hypothetical protein GW17_00043790 [Ensete ventricosum]RWW73306.1 hypothetical protein BHE74_00018817 [Ensete ventricosum]RZS05399.1 hypothetical protein BHM03_00035908 [Ensete ventricosum]
MITSGPHPHPLGLTLRLSYRFEVTRWAHRKDLTRSSRVWLTHRRPSWVPIYVGVGHARCFCS